MSFREREREREGRSKRRGIIDEREVQRLRQQPEEPYAPIVYKFPRVTGILDTKPTVRYSLGHPFPQIKYGFQYWNYQTKDNMHEVVNSMGARKTYQVLNSFAHRIANHPEASVDVQTVKYFGLDTKPGIMSRGFYKMWELIVLFELVPTTSKFYSVHLAEAPGSFIQAVILYRDKFAKDTKHDTHYGITIHSEQKNVPEMERKFMAHYGDRLKIHKTVPLEHMRKGLDNGDLTLPDTILNLARINGGRAQLVTADGGMNWVNENLQEQEAMMLIFCEILSALYVQKLGGNFVIKLYETFTIVSVKLLILLSNLYAEVHIIKPLMSRDSNSERYLVCKHLNITEDARTAICGTLMDVLIQWRSQVAQGLQVQDIFTEYTIPRELNPMLRASNVQLANRQLIVIDKMVLYIRENDLYGKTYEDAIAKQIDSSKFWIATFYREDLGQMRDYMVSIQEQLAQTRALEIQAHDDADDDN